ncbi:MAG: hypothetical protein WC243_04460 [Patescibacteria group bacterium]|jgi:hypothetical protein
MKVWFGCTTSQFEKYKANYFAIRDYLKELGCIVLFDWLEDADKFMREHPGEKRNIKNVYRQVVEAIDNADFSVIEYSVPNFSSSHQINYSILKKKPTLVLRLNKENEKFPDSYLEALDSPFLKVKSYTLSSFKEIVDEFVGYTKLESGPQRYNIVLDKQHKYYLDWASARYKKSRSLIIRQAIEEKIDQDDDYGRYIGK